MGVREEGIRSYDYNSPNCRGQNHEKALTSTTAELWQHLHGRTLEQRPCQTHPGQNDQSRQQHELGIPYTNHRHSTDNKVTQQRKKGRGKRQNASNKKCKEVEKGNQQILDKTRSDSCYLRNNSWARDKGEAGEPSQNCHAHDILTEVTQKYQVYKSTSQQGTGIVSKSFKQLMGYIKKSKMIRRKTRKSKGNKLSDTPSRRTFRLLNKRDQNYLRVQLSAWFPCVFPRPTFTSIQSAVVRMTSSMFHDLCRFQMTDLNKQISEAKVQRALLRNEQFQQRSSKDKPVQFVSSVIPECQKRISTFTLDSTREVSFTSTGNQYKHTELDPRLMIAKVNDCSTRETHHTHNAEGNWRESATYKVQTQSESARQRESLGRNDCGRRVLLPLAEMKHNLVPDWFQAMMRNELVIYIEPACRVGESDASIEIKQLMRSHRRIVLGKFPHSEGLSTENENLVIAVREQEVTTPQAFRRPVIIHNQTECSVPSLSQSENIPGRHEPNRSVVSDHYKNSACLHDISFQSHISTCENDMGPHLSPSRNRIIVSYQRARLVKSSLEDQRQQFREHIRTCLDERQVQTLSSDKLLDGWIDERSPSRHCQTKEPWLSISERDNTCLYEKSPSRHCQTKEPWLSISEKDNTCLYEKSPSRHCQTKEPSLSISERDNTCLCVGSSSSVDTSHRMKKEATRNHISRHSSASKLALMDSPERRKDHILLKPRLISTDRCTGSLSNSSVTGTSIDSGDININQNIDLQEAGRYLTIEEPLRESQPATETPGTLEWTHLSGEKHQPRRPPHDPPGRVFPSVFNDAVLRAATGASRDRASVPTEYIMCHETLQTDGSRDTLPKKIKNKICKKVRFGEFNRREERTLDKSNSSVHGVQNDLEYVQDMLVDDVMEPGELCGTSATTTTTTASQGNYTRSTAKVDNTESRVLDDMEETMVEVSTEMFPVGDDKDVQFIHDEKDSSHTFLEKEYFSNRPSVPFRSCIWNRQFEKNSELCECQRLLDPAQNSNVQFWQENIYQKNTSPLFSCTEHRDSSIHQKSVTSPYTNNLTGDKHQLNYHAVARKVVGLSPSQSLIDFVKEQWRSSCTSERGHASSPVAGTDVSQTKQGLRVLKSACLKNSYPVLCESLQHIYSSSYSKNRSPLREPDPECDKRRGWHSIQREPSYETMCAERHENYRKLCHVLAKHYQSLSPEGSQDIDNIRSPGARVLSLSEDQLRKTPTETKATRTFENSLLKSSNNTALPPSIEQLSPVEAGHSYPRFCLDRNWENAFQISACSSVNGSSVQNTAPKSSRSNVTTGPKFEHTSRTPFAAREYQVTVSSKHAKQTQTSPSSAYTKQQKQVPNSLSSMLDLSREETKWLMGNVRSWGLTDPNKPSEFLCILFALHKLLERYFPSPEVQRQRSGYRYNRLTGSAGYRQRVGKKAGETRNLNKSSPLKKCMFSESVAYPSYGLNSSLAASTKSTCNAAMFELAQNSSVNNGRDSPSNSAQIPNDENLLEPQPIRVLQLGSQETLEPDPSKPKKDSTGNQRRRAKAHENIPESPIENITHPPTSNLSLSPTTPISRAPFGNMSSSTVKNISMSPTTPISRAPTTSISMSPPESATGYTGYALKHSPEWISLVKSNLMNEVTEANSKFPNGLPSTLKQSSQQLQQTDNSTSKLYRILLASGKTSKVTNPPTTKFVCPYKNIQTDAYNKESIHSPTKKFVCPFKNIQTDAYNMEKIDSPTFLNNDSQTPLPKTSRDTHVTRRLQTFRDGQNMPSASPYQFISMSRKPLGCDMMTDTTPISIEVPKMCRSILNPSPNRNYHTSNDYPGQSFGSSTPQQPERRRMVPVPPLPPRFDSMEDATTAEPNRTMDTTVSSANRITVPAIFPEDGGKQRQEPCQMSAAQMWFRDICDKVNTNSKPTNSSTQHPINSQANSARGTKLRTDVILDGTQTKLDHAHTSKYNTPGTLNIAASPRQQNEKRLNTIEVDNRLLDPSKNYIDLDLLENPRKGMKAHPHVTAFNEYISSQLDQLKVHAHEKNCETPGQIGKEQSGILQADKISSPDTRSEGHNPEIHHPTNNGFEKPNKLAPYTNKKNTQNCVSASIQTCVCISQPNRMCLCGYLSQNETCDPREITPIVSTNEVKKEQQVIQFKSVCIQTTNGEKETNHVANKKGASISNYSAKPARSKHGSPSQTKYRNKKFQTEQNGPVKNCFDSFTYRNLPALITPPPEHQFQDKVGDIMSLQTTKCVQACLASQSKSNQINIREENVICSTCKQRIQFARNNDMFDKQNLPSEIGTNSSDGDQNRMCACSVYVSSGTDRSDQRVTPGHTPQRESKQLTETSKSNQDSSLIVAKTGLELARDDWIHGKDKQPIIHIQYRSKHATSPAMCSIKTRAFSQQLKEQIAGIIENSRLLQQHAAQLRNKCKCLEMHQWPSINQSMHGATTPCGCYTDNLRLDCQPFDPKPSKCADKSTNANPRLDQHLHKEDSCKLDNIHIKDFNINNSGCRVEQHNPPEGRSTRNSADKLTTPHKTWKPKNTMFINNKSGHVRRAIDSENGQRMNPRENHEDIIVPSTYCKFNRQNMDQNSKLHSRVCLQWQEDDKDKNWNARPPAQKNDGTSTRLDSNPSGSHNQDYMINEPSAEAYQYVRTHFPDIFRSPPRPEDKCVTRDKRVGHRSCWGGEVALKEYGEGVLRETESGVASRQAQTSVPDSEPQSDIEGRQAQSSMACSAAQSDVTCSEYCIAQSEAQFGVLRSMDGPDAATLGTTQHLGEFDQRGVQLSKGLHLSRLTCFDTNDSVSGPYISTQLSTDVAVKQEVQNDLGICRFQDLRKNTHHKPRIVKNKSPFLSQQEMSRGDESLPFMSKYMINPSSHLTRNDWKWAYTIGSLTQPTLPVARISDKACDDVNNRHYHTTMTSQTYRSNIFNRGTAATEDLSNMSSIRDEYTGTRSIGTMVSFGRQQPHLPETTAAGGDKTFSSTQSQESRILYSHYSCDVSLPCSPTVSTAEASSSESLVSNNTCINRQKITPALTTNRKTKSLHLNPNAVPSVDNRPLESYLFNYRNKAMQIGESSGAESSSNMSSSIHSVEIAQHQPLVVASAVGSHSQGHQTRRIQLFYQQKQLLGQTDKLPGIEGNSFPQQNGRQFHPQQKVQLGEHSRPFGRINLECESLVGTRPLPHVIRDDRPLPSVVRHDRPLPPVVKQDILLPEIIKHDKLIEVDSQDSCHGIEDLPLDSGPTESGHKVHKPLGRTDDGNVFSDTRSNHEYRSSVSIHERVLFARPLPTPKLDMGSNVSPDAEVSSLDDASAVLICSSVVSTENGRLPSKPMLKLPPQANSERRKFVSETIDDFSLGAAINQFEVSMACPEKDNCVSDISPDSSVKEIIIWWNSSEYSKKRYNTKDLTRCSIGTSMSLVSKGEPDHLVRSGRCKLPCKGSRLTGSPQHDQSASCTGKTAYLSDLNESFNYATQFDKPGEAFPYQGHPDQSTLSLPDQTKVDSNIQMRTSFFGCAEVILADEQMVVIEGAYIGRRSSLGDNQVEDERSLWKWRNVAPFKLVLSRCMADGDTADFNGTYSRQLLTSDSCFQWKLVAGRPC